MHCNNWTETELDYLMQNHRTKSLAQIAKDLGKTYKAIENRVKRLRRDGLLPEPRLPGQGPNPSLGATLYKIPFSGPFPKNMGKTVTEAPEEPSKEEHLRHYRAQVKELQREVEVLRREKAATEILVEQAVDLAPRAYKPAPPLKNMIHPKGKQSPQSAVLMFSDTHIGQVIHPDQTLGLGGYNFDIFLRRLQRLQDSAFSILQDHTTTPVPEIVVAMLGDMLHGNLVHSVEAGQVNTLFEQFYAAGHAIAQFFRNLSRLAPVRVHTVVGNHPRWGTQHKMPTDNRYSNLDQFLYAYVKALLREEPRVTINLDKQPFSLFEVQGFQFYAGHGDHLRGGDKVLGIPNHAVGRNLSNTSQVFSAAGKRLPNYYLFGHMHRPITLPHASGEVIINGGFPGIDGFALMAAFNSSHPSQKFFLMHKKFGRSAAYDLRLDLGDPNPHSFTLPTEFTCK